MSFDGCSGSPYRQDGGKLKSVFFIYSSPEPGVRLANVPVTTGSTKRKKKKNKKEYFIKHFTFV